MLPKLLANKVSYNNFNNDSNNDTETDNNSTRRKSNSNTGNILDENVIGEEALCQQYGKKVEKPVVRFLERLNLRNATIVTRGSYCQFAMNTM